MLQQQAIENGINPDIVDEQIANAYKYDDPDAEFYQFMLDLQRSKHEKAKHMLTYTPQEF
jgi:predicted RNA methylase